MTLSATHHPLTACLRVALHPPTDPTPISSTHLSRFRGLYAAREALSEAHDIIIQAKALVLCGLPYKRVASRSVSRRARVGARSSLTVTFTAVDPTQPLPFGADRALLGWIQTLAYRSPHIRFSSLTEFFRAFGLSDSGREYRVFHERLARLLGLSISVQLTSDEGARHLTMHPLKRSFIPTRDEAHHLLGSHLASQLVLTPRDYGFELDPDFYEYLRANPVPLPLPIMRAFHNSPKAWDFASLVLYRSYAARSSSVMIWPELLEQIAANADDPLFISVLSVYGPIIRRLIEAEEFTAVQATIDRVRLHVPNHWAEWETRLVHALVKAGRVDEAIAKLALYPAADEFSLPQALEWAASGRAAQGRIDEALVLLGRVERLTLFDDVVPVLLARLRQAGRTADLEALAAKAYASAQAGDAKQAERFSGAQQERISVRMRDLVVALAEADLPAWTVRAAAEIGSRTGSRDERLKKASLALARHGRADEALSVLENLPAGEARDRAVYEVVLALAENGHPSAVAKAELLPIEGEVREVALLNVSSDLARHGLGEPALAAAASAAGQEAHQPSPTSP